MKIFLEIDWFNSSFYWIVFAVPLGETNEDFYRYIYKGQRGSLRPRGGRRLQSSAPEGDNEPRWPCHMCTFRNHPLMDTCEQCEMPRVLLGKISSSEDPLFFARPQTTPNNSNTPLAVGLNTWLLKYACFYCLLLNFNYY